VTASEAAARTALLFMTPEVERRLPAGSYGSLGAHMTVLSPFHPADSVVRYAEDVARLARTFPRCTLVLDRVGSFGDTTYLGSSRDGEVVRLLDRVIARYPERPPYGRPGIETVPHVTLPPGTTTKAAKLLLGVSIELRQIIWMAAHTDVWKPVLAFDCG